MITEKEYLKLISLNRKVNDIKKKIWDSLKKDYNTDEKIYDETDVLDVIENQTKSYKEFLQIIENTYK